MRLAIISDLHLGDPTSLMKFDIKKPETRDDKSGDIRTIRMRQDITYTIPTDSKYPEFKEKIKARFGGEKLDFLILLGDILDFSISSYTDAYAVGYCFFQQLIDDEIAKQVIYCPGNHDFDLWNTIQYEINVSNKIKNGKLPTPFRMSIPGILDDRKDSPIRGLTLHNVARHSVQKNHTGYAGLFLDNITDPPTRFHFVFPNIYMMTDDDKILITHGQYLEIYWSFIGKWAPVILKPDLKHKDPNTLDVGELVSVNFPPCQLACSAIGQAGALTDLIQQTQNNVKAHDLSHIELYIANLKIELKKLGFFKFPFKCVKYLAFRFAKRKLLKALKNMKTTRHDPDFINNEGVNDRLTEYYKSTLLEIDEINKIFSPKISEPERVIYGHTHVSVPWDPNATPVDLPSGKKLQVFNSGGWIKVPGKEYCDAEIFYYETGKGFSSEHIR